MGCISSFNDPRVFTKVHLERSRPLGVPFGIFCQIWSLPVDLISQKLRIFSDYEFVRAVSRVLMTLEMVIKAHLERSRPLEVSFGIFAKFGHFRLT